MHLYTAFEGIFVWVQEVRCDSKAELETRSRMKQKDEKLSLHLPAA